LLDLCALLDPPDHEIEESMELIGYNMHWRIMRRWGRPIANDEVLNLLSNGTRIENRSSFAGTTILPSQSKHTRLARIHRLSLEARSAAGTTLRTSHGIAKIGASILLQPDICRRMR